MFKKRIRLYLTAMLLVCSCILSACGASTRTVNELKKGEIIRARRIYAEKIAGSAKEITQFENEYRAYLLELYNDLNNNKKSPGEVERQLNSLLKFEYSSLAEGYRREFNYLIASKNDYKQAEIYMKGGQYLEAIPEYYKVLENDTNNIDAWEKRENAMIQYENLVFAKAEEQLEAGDAEKAYVTVYTGYMDLKNVLPYMPGTLAENVLMELNNKASEYKTKYEQNYAGSILGDVAAAQQTGDYYGAISIALDAYVSSDTDELETVVEDSCKLYINHILDEAAKFFTNSGDYGTAMAVISQCADNLDNELNIDVEYMDAILERAYEYYSGFTPLKLDEKNTFYTDGSGYFNTKTRESDNLGQEYERLFYAYAYAYDAIEMKATYYVQDYDCFSGRLILRSQAKDIDSCGCLAVFADGNAIYQSPYIGKGFMPIDLSFDISAAETIALYFSDIERASFGIANMIVYKNPALHAAFEERL